MSIDGERNTFGNDWDCLGMKMGSGNEAIRTVELLRKSLEIKPWERGTFPLGMRLGMGMTEDSPREGLGMRILCQYNIVRQESHKPIDADQGLVKGETG